MLYDPKQNPVVKALYDAADLIETKGHTKYRLWDDDGSVCARGAFYKALGYPEINSTDILNQVYKLDEALADHLRLHHLGGMSAALTVVDWNNAPERTKEEVVEALRGAAEMVTVGA